MNTSLGILLPVCNAQHSLAVGVANILEVLPEWSDRFALCIVDDGSIDDTVEVARDLCACYPQVSIVRHPVRLGLSEAIQTGLDNAPADVILIGNDAYQLEPDDLRTLWKLRDLERRQANEDKLPAAISMGGRRDDGDGRLRRAGLDQRLGFQVVRRATFEELRLSQAIDAIARIDAANRAGGISGIRRAAPKFLDTVRRLTWGE